MRHKIAGRSESVVDAMQGVGAVKSVVDIFDSVEQEKQSNIKRVGCDIDPDEYADDFMDIKGGVEIIRRKKAPRNNRYQEDGAVNGVNRQTRDVRRNHKKSREE